MRAIFLVLFIVLFINSPCFSQEEVGQASRVIIDTSQAKPIIGTVESVIIGDSVEGTPSAIVITDDYGRKLYFGVKSYTVLTDENGKVIKLDKIESGDEVSIIYVKNKRGFLEAVSITTSTSVQE